MGGLGFHNIVGGANRTQTVDGAGQEDGELDLNTFSLMELRRSRSQTWETLVDLGDTPKTLPQSREHPQLLPRMAAAPGQRQLTQPPVCGTQPGRGSHRPPCPASADQPLPSLWETSAPAAVLLLQEAGGASLSVGITSHPQLPSSPSQGKPPSSLWSGQPCVRESHPLIWQTWCSSCGDVGMGRVNSSRVVSGQPSWFSLGRGRGLSPEGGEYPTSFPFSSSCVSDSVLG